MLRVTITDGEIFDESTNTFEEPVLAVLELEHSLVSLSKWESFWEKPFLSKDDKTDEETFSYIQMMALGDTPSMDLLAKLSPKNVSEINDYIVSKMTATWFSDIDGKGKSSGQIITAEVVYSWMIALNIPFECQHWHFNRLLTLIRVCDKQNSPPKKMSAAEIARRNRELNARRKAQLGTRG